MPEPGSMYAPDHATWVEVPDLAKGLCGQTRPIHFRGVCTVVLKLFMLSAADVAVFGQKTGSSRLSCAVWCVILTCLCALKRSPSYVNPTELALSSRNVYLAPEERDQAPEIRRGLLPPFTQVGAGGRDQRIPCCVRPCCAAGRSSCRAGTFGLSQYCAPRIHGPARHC